MYWWEIFKHWVLSIGKKYEVDPFLFASIYLGAIPFFSLCLAWTIKNITNKKPFVLPALLTGLFFISAYLYLMIVGRKIPGWIYIFIAVMVLYGIVSTAIKIKSQTGKD